MTGSPKISLDADALYDAVVARFNAGDLSELKFDYDTEPCAPVDLQRYYDQFATEMKDAYYDEEKKELVAEKVGFGFDVSYYTQQIAMADAGTTITIQAEEMQPEVTLADLEKEYFADVLGSCDSPHTAQAGRTKNLELACKAIVTGESLGQVASQTIQALVVSDDVSTLPVLRPLIGMDKEEIVRVARHVGTFDTSILPYEDCCTVFTPRHPKTRPHVEEVREMEQALDVEGLVRRAMDGREVVKLR